MARRITTLLVDDLDGSEAVGTVRFAWEGTDYTIDLNAEHITAFEDTIQPYLDGAQAVSGRGKYKRTTRKASTTTGTSQASQIRQWAVANGFTVPDRGRLPREVTDAYDRRNNLPAVVPDFSAVVAEVADMKVKRQRKTAAAETAAAISQ